MIILFYKNQKTFIYIIIEFRNSLAYIQQQIDFIIKTKKDFAQIYINDIIIFSYMFNNYLDYLQRVFQKLKDFNIMFNSKKYFLVYSSIILLEQKIDIFNLISAKNKLVII